MGGQFEDRELFHHLIATEEQGFAASKHAGLRMVKPRRRPGNNSFLENSQDSVMLQYTGAQQERGEFGGQRYAHTYKKPRRRTVYVPSDDTSILTIHPGSKLEAGLLKSPLFSLNSSSLLKRQALGAAARRAPLQSSLRPLQENGFNVDVVGASSGKENMPPDKFDAKMPEVQRSGSERVSFSVAVPHHNIILPDRLDDCHRRLAEDETPNCASIFPMVRAGSTQRVSSRRNPKVDQDSASNRNFNHHGPDRKAPANPGINQAISNFQSKPVESVLSQEIATREQQDPIANGNTTDRSDEATWLDHQEIVIKQLVNEVFDAACEGKTASFTTHEESKQSLLRIYQDTEFSILHDKIQASLEFGALSPPCRASTEISRFRHDLGLRRKFVTTWIESYDLEALHAAAEVVTGREVQHRDSSKTRKKEIQILIDSYLLRNEDVLEHQQPYSIWCWRRTVSRSLMMILLMASVFSILISPSLWSGSFRAVWSLSERLTYLTFISVSEF